MTNAAVVPRVTDQTALSCRLAGRAMSAIVMASLLIIVAAAAILIKARGGDWWTPALAPIGALGLMLLGIVLRRQDETLAFAIAQLVDLPVRRPIAGAAITIIVALLAATLVYFARAEITEKGHFYQVQVYEAANVPGKRVAGMTVIMERRRDQRSAAVEYLQETDSDGIVSFPAAINDWISLRLERKGTDGSEVLPLNPGDLIDADKLLRIYTVKLDGFPPDSWTLVAKAPQGGRTLDGIVGFMRAERYMFRWWDGLPQQAPLGPEQFETEIAPFGVPQAEIIIRRQGYVLGFSPYWRLPRWAASRVSHERAAPRGIDRYTTDPLVPAGVQAKVTDYANNPFDRGHLVRRSDVGVTPELSESINMMTAITPQTTLFNQKIWYAIEAFTTDLGRTPGHEVLIIRGPMFLPASGSEELNLRLIGPGRLPVPTHFFQVAVDRSAAGMQMHCFVVPNQSIYNELAGLDRATIVARYRARLSMIEQNTGLRLLPNLDRATTPGC